MLRKVKLYGELADFVGHKELDAVITCTADAIRFLVTNFPKLESHMSDRHYKVIINNEYEIGETEIHHPIGQSDVSIVPIISGSGGIGKALLGVALIAVSFSAGIFAAPMTLSGGFAAAGFGAKAAFGIGASLVLGGVSELLFPLPQPPDFADDSDPRVSFSFSGVQNVSRAGTTLPICYGEIVTGSVVISAGIDTHQVKT